MLWAKRYYSFSQLLNWDWFFYHDPCPEANALWYAIDAEAQKAEENASIIYDVSDALEPYGCEIVPGKRICVDFFIANARSLAFGGDDRTHDPDAGWRASRVQVFLDPQTLSCEVKINSSRVTFGAREITKADSARLYRPEDTICEADPQRPGWIHMKMKYYNNFCITRSTCPAIDAEIWLEPDPSKVGGYEVYWKRDGFPSMTVKSLKQDGSGYDIMIARDESIKTFLLNWLGLVWRIRQDNQLPPGCNWQ